MPESNPLHALAERRSRGLLTLLLAAVLSAGCAQLPDASSAPRFRAAESFAGDVVLQADPIAWPAEDWWVAWGDAQLRGLIDEALRDSPDLMSARARLERAEAFAELAGSALEPRGDVNASVSLDKLSENHLIPRNARTEGWNDYGRAVVDFRWELDFWGRNRAGLAAATSEREASRAELAQARSMLVSVIALHYAELSRLFANRALLLRSATLRHDMVGLLAKRHANGLETVGGVRTAEAARAAAEGAVLVVDERIALQRNRLAALVGAGPDRGLSIRPPEVSLDKPFGLPARLPVDLLGRRPDVVAARLLAQAQESRIAQKKAGFYPNVNLAAFVGVQSLGLELLGRGGSTVGGVGPALSLPLFDGGRLRAELRGTQATHAESVARYNATLTRALQEVADVAVAQRALGPQLAKAREAVEAASAAHRVARNRFEGGLSTALDALSAEERVIDSLTLQTDLLAQSLTLDVALNRALGGGYQSTESRAQTPR